MLVQPALTTHLLCRPVSIADSMGSARRIASLVRGNQGVIRSPPFSFWACNPQLGRSASARAGSANTAIQPVLSSSSSTSSSMPRRRAGARVAIVRHGAAAPAIELIGKIQRSQHGHAQRVHCAAVRSHCAHLAVHQLSQLADVAVPGRRGDRSGRRSPPLT